VTVSPSSLPQGTGDASDLPGPDESPRPASPDQDPVPPLAPDRRAVTEGVGWQTKVVSEKLAKPITTDTDFTSTVAEIDWSGGSIRWAVRRSSTSCPGHPEWTDELVFQSYPGLQRRAIVSWIQIRTRRPHPLPPGPHSPADQSGGKPVDQRRRTTDCRPGGTSTGETPRDSASWL